MPAITSHRVLPGRVRAGGGGLGAVGGVRPILAGTSGEISFTKRCLDSALRLLADPLPNKLPLFLPKSAG